ncbi:DUF4262 domain-containing protein [Litorilituus lipolyticus]|uniref:DUF4262 domain-containing protein n=1 Tax=Litorilituus lipolyticus TaxID=2491017 RepID=A0A502L0E3_9GAMM|nr:DUF4262 domain-containing protein [Litorilituus lipolyticus]TPH15751.1 DUF4262 domain-containing protein [Litorilituus lipolyticus]
MTTTENYFKGLRKKVKQYGYTLMSVTAEYPRADEHAAYCYTIGLSDYGYPELLFADCFYDETLSLIDTVLELIGKLEPLEIGHIIKSNNHKYKAVELLDGVKGEISAHAKKYFELYRHKTPDYDLVYLGQADVFGLFPDEKEFVESKHIRRCFYKLQAAKSFVGLVLHQPEETH